MIETQEQMSPIHNFLVDLAKQFNLRDFVETGTQAGVTFRAVREHFDRAFTIELDPWAQDTIESERFFMFQGSSGDRLASILLAHNITRALFWLDAHGNETFFVDDGNNQVPKELEAIKKYAPDSLVVVDDITFDKDKYWVNTSYEFVVPSGWQVTYALSRRAAILHCGGYNDMRIAE